MKRHPSVDRSNSYPETSSLSYKDDSLDPMSSIALPPSMCSKREGYLSLRDFRHEQLKRVSNKYEHNCELRYGYKTTGLIYL